jgi:hypothetical protein
MFRYGVQPRTGDGIFLRYIKFYCTGSTVSSGVEVATDSVSEV